MINELKALELIRRQKETGLTITAFCANEGIPKSSFYYWRKKRCNKPVNKFIPVVVNTTTATMKSAGMNQHSNTGDDFLFEMDYPNGTRLRMKSTPDIDNLRLLVSLLD